MRKAGRLIIVLAPALACCSAADFPIPAGAAADARFLAFDPASAPACGPLSTMPARGRLPALGALMATDGVLLFQLDPAPIAARYADGESVPVLRISERNFSDGVDAIALAPPQKVWRLQGDEFEAVAARPDDVRLAMVTKNACAPRLEDRCKSGASIDATCAQFEETLDIFIPEGAGSGVGFVLPLDADHALISRRPTPAAGIRQRLMIADATRSQAIGVSAPDDVPYLAAYQRPENDELYIYGPDRQLFRSTGNFDFTDLSGPKRLYPLPTAAWLDGPRDLTSPFELFALDNFGAFDHFDGTTWTQLSGPSPSSFPTPHGGVAWIGPGEAVAVGSRDSTVLRYKDRGLHIETFANDDRATAIAVIPGFGTVLGTARGVLYVDRGDADWVELESPHDDRPVHGISPFRDGFIFGRSLSNGSGGQIAEWVPGVGLCDSVQVTNRDVQTVHPIENGFVVYSKDAPTDPFVGFVREKKVYPECAAPAD